MNDKIVMPVWTFGLFLVVMNTTMFNVSIPSIIHDLGITADLASWVISGYSIGYALSTIIYSRLSDFLPIRRLLAVGLLILGTSSVIGFLSHSFDTLLLARLLQSAGSGAMSGLGLVLAGRYIPYERRGRAITMIAAGSAMAFGLGPVIGGTISEYYGWNGVFLVTSLVIPVLPILWFLLPKETPKRIRFDIVGAALTIINASTLLVAVTHLSFGGFILSLVIFLCYGWHMKKAKDPFIKPVLFRDTGYRKLLGIGFCIYVLNLGNLFLMPLILSTLFNQSAFLVGMMIFPGAFLSAFLSRWVGRWIDRYGNFRFLLIGHLLLIVAVAVLSLGLSWSPYIILSGYLFFAPSFSAASASLNNETSRILPKELIGSGLGLMQLIQFFGGSFSVAVCGILLTLQKKVLLLVAYQHVYEVLLIIILCSLGVLLWYHRSAYKEANESYRLMVTK